MSSPLWLLQNKNMALGFVQNTENVLNKLNIPYQGIYINPQNKIVNLENYLNEENYILRSGTKIIEAITNANNLSDLITRELTTKESENSIRILNNLKRGVFFDSKSFDFTTYQQYDLPLLNTDVQILSYFNDKDVVFKNHMFVKPSEDNKFFTGGVMTPGMKLGDFVLAQNPMSYNKDQLLVVAPIKSIAAEYRFYVIDQKIVTASSYRLGKYPNFALDIPSSLLEVAKNYAKKYQPSEVFVMDIAETSGKYKIVEYNCWNGSSLYNCDAQSLFLSVESHVQSKNPHKKLKIKKLKSK
jgi:hypothetical protein